LKSLKHTYIFIFFIGIFFIPINSYEGIPLLGEFRFDSSIIFFFISSLFFTIDYTIKGKVKIPFKNLYFQIFLVFVIWIIISTFLNYNSIEKSYFKKTSGINRFIRQFVALLILIYIFILSYNIFTNFNLKILFFKLRKIFFISFIVVSIYGFLEILIIYFHISILEKVIYLFNYFPFTNVYLDYNFKRISSLSMEPPFLAMFLITIAGWIFSYILTNKSFNKYIPSIVLFILTFFSGSRTALIVISIQFLVFLVFAFRVSNIYKKKIKRFLLIIGAIVLLIFIFNGEKFVKEIDTKLSSLNFKENLIKNTSNRSRFGIQYTSLLIFKEHPILGVGYGQQAYYGRSKYPDWATKDNYEFKLWYLNNNVKSFPPGYNLYTRLLAETGIIGFSIFVLLIGLLVYQSILLLVHRKETEKTIAIVLLISFIGFAINWLQIDSFRMYGFWISFALIIVLLQTKKKYIKPE